MFMMKLIIFVCAMIVASNIVGQPPALTQYEQDRRQAQAEEKTARGGVDAGFVTSLSDFTFPKKDKPKVPLYLEENLKINDADRILSRAFSTDKKIQIVKIWNDECGGNKIIDVNDEKCIKQAEFAIASRYSFSSKIYNKSPSFIGIFSGEIIADSNPEWTQMLVDIGESSIDTVNSENIDVKKLKDFNVAGLQNEQLLKNLKTGILYKGLNLSGSSKLSLNHTYLIRSVFDDLNVIGKRIKPDLIYTFQVIKQDENVVTIIWKEIQKKRRL
jgi:hypothetical protein